MFGTRFSTYSYSVGTHSKNLLESWIACDYEKGDLFYSTGPHTPEIGSGVGKKWRWRDWKARNWDKEEIPGSKQSTHMAIFWPTPDLNVRTFVSSWFSTEGTLISGSTASHCGMVIRRGRENFTYVQACYDYIFTIITRLLEIGGYIGKKTNQIVYVVKITVHEEQKYCWCQSSKHPPTSHTHSACWPPHSPPPTHTEQDTHTEGHTHSRMDTQTHTHRDTHTHSDTHTQRDKHTLAQMMERIRSIMKTRRKVISTGRISGKNKNKKTFYSW